MTQQDIAYEGDIDDIVIGKEADSGGFITLPPGIYPFTIEEPIERENYSGSDKLPPCVKVTVKLKVDAGPLGTTNVNHRIYVTRNNSWKIKQLFVGVGLIRQDVEEFTPPWRQLVGTSGAVEIINNEYNGKKYNDVKGILTPDKAAEAIGAAMATSPAPTPAPAPTASQPMTMPTFTPVDPPAPAPAAPAPTQTTFNYPGATQ